MNKKLCSALAAAAIFTQCLPWIAYASGDTLSINSPSRIIAGITLSLNIQSESTNFSYQWLSSDSEDGEYERLKSDTSNQYVITPRDKNKYIKAEITNLDNGSVTVSDNYVHVENLGPVSRTGFNADNISKTMLTPSENIFSIGGQKFILLEEMNDKASHYYILSEGMYGNRAFDANGYAKFDPNSEGNLGKFLNNEFLTAGGGGNKLPEKIIEHIDFEHVWNTEAGIANGDCPEDYSFTAGISFLSMSEAVKYRDKYGWQPLGEGRITPWWSRTQRGIGGSSDNILVMMNSNDSGKGNMWDRACTTTGYYIRPAFYLDEDFFGEVKCDLDNTGENIISLIKDRYTLDKLKDIYSTAELAKLGFDIKTAVITAEKNTYSAMTELTVSMSDKNAVDFEYRWFVADSEEEEGKEVFSNRSNKYIYATNDVGKWISASVTPIYADGTRGEEVFAENKIHVDKIGKLARTNYQLERRDYRDNPAEYLFEAGGEKLILLDAFDSEEDAVYVMTADEKGTHTFDTGNRQIFLVDDNKNIGHWLNNDFLSANVTISPNVQQYINKEHLWWTEGANSSGSCPADYSFNAGVALLSRSEYSKYWGKFGWDPNESIKTAWWLRSGRDTGASDVFCGIGIQDGNYSTPTANGYGNTWNKAANASYYVRPVFYLSRDFMLNVKVTSIGEKAAEAMRSMYTVEELLACNAGYTENDLIKMGIIERPSADKVELEGLAAVGAELFGSYVYSGKPEGASSLGFEMSDNKEDGYVKFADGKSAQLTSAQSGKYVRFFVIPTDKDGLAGEKYYSEPVRIIGNAKIAARNVNLTDEKGNEITQLADISRINAKFTLVNYTNEAKKACAMIFVYDKENNMLDNRGVTVDIASGDSVAVENLAIALPQYTEGNYAKLIIWDGFTTMSPAQNCAAEIK